MARTRDQTIHVVGGGLAGSEAAWQIARAGLPVVLHEMRPRRGTDAHQGDGLAELVCSNSFRSDDAEHNAVGLLHKLGPPAYATLVDPVLNILAQAPEAQARELAEQVSQAQLRGIVQAVDFDRRELTIHDRRNRQHTFVVAQKAQIARGATMPGASVIVHFDLRNNVTNRIEDASDRFTVMVQSRP